MTDRNRNALIGLFVFAGLAALGVLIILFGEARGWIGASYTIQAHFDRVQNVRQGASVGIAGVQAGQVGDIKLVDPQDPGKGAYVALEIEKKFTVLRGSNAIVESSLMGQGTITIMPPRGYTEPLPTDGTGTIEGLIQNPLESIIDPSVIATLEKSAEQIGTLAQALTPAANAITDLLERRSISEVDSPEAAAKGVTANLSTAIERLHSVLKHFDTVLGDPATQSNVKLAVDNIRAASDDARSALGNLRQFSVDLQAIGGQAKQVVGNVDATVSIARQRIDELGQKLTANTDQLSKLLDSLNAAGQDMAEGKGALGMMLRDPKLYDEILLTVQRLGGAANEMQVLIKQWQREGLLSSVK